MKTNLTLALATKAHPTSGIHVRARSPRVPLVFRRRAGPEMLERARTYADEMHLRRTCRDFSSETVPLEVVQRTSERMS